MLRGRSLFWFLALSLAAISACRGKFCNGTIGCEAFSEAKCPTVPGCFWAPACSLRESPPMPCSAATAEAKCTGPKCVWSGAACISRCETLSTEETCKATASTDRDQYGELTWDCVWTHCQGQAEQTCGDYEISWCPGDLGCYVDEPHGFPDS